MTDQNNSGSDLSFEQMFNVLFGPTIQVTDRTVIARYTYDPGKTISLNYGMDRSGEWVLVSVDGGENLPLAVEIDCPLGGHTHWPLDKHTHWFVRDGSKAHYVFVE